MLGDFATPALHAIPAGGLPTRERDASAMRPARLPSLRIGLPGLAWAPPGELTIVVASPRWLEGLEARLLLDTVAGGRDAFVVCGDNRLDAYGLLAQARARGLESELADGVWLARAFTVHQLVALLEETLPQAARERTLGVALATGLLEMFLDEDVTPGEARTLFTRSVRRLDAWAKATDFPVVATVAQGGGARADALLEACGASRKQAERDVGGLRSPNPPGVSALRRVEDDAIDFQTRLEVS